MSFTSKNVYILVLIGAVLVTIDCSLHAFRQFQTTPGAVSVVHHPYSASLDLTNATALFNEVNNALKQKNADLNPNSVSFFPAFVPVGTHLYRATHDGGKIPDSFEWVAFDYEFSYNFARFNRGKPRRWGPGGHGRLLKEGPLENPGLRGEKADKFDNSEVVLRKTVNQTTDDTPEGGPHRRWPPRFTHADPNLLTFEVVRPLDKMIYLGGASAAKSRTGTMDTQFVLSGAQSYEEFNEREAAATICEWGRKHGGIDGFIRLEIGFEAVICDFHDKLRLVSNVTLTNITNTLEFPAEVFSSNETMNVKRSGVIDILDAMAGFELYQAGERVYDREPRVLLDMSKFVTPIGRTYIDPSPLTRRIFNLSDDVKAGLIKDVGQMLATPNNPYDSNDWQSITEGIEKKFGPILLNLNNSLAMYYSVWPGEEGYGPLGTNLTAYTFNYIRRYLNEPVYELTRENKRLALWDAIHPVHPIRTANEDLVFQAVVAVLSNIIDTVNAAFKLGRSLLGVYNGVQVADAEARIAALQQTITDLLDQLNWPFLYECKSICGPDEMCYIPTWGPSPLGWGSNGRSGLGFEQGPDGVTRVAKDLQCLSMKNILR